MSRKKTRRELEKELDFLEHSVENLMTEHGNPSMKKRKSWTERDLINLKPLTHPQRIMIQDYFEGQHICAHGSAGTGKTLIALYLAAREVFDPESKINHIKIIRSAVPSRDQGFLPGTLDEKQQFYELPYHDIFSFLFGRDSTYADMKKVGLVEFATTSYVRGLTWDNTIVVLDEGQNLEFSEINSVVTRLGKNSRMIFIGDQPQCDLHKWYEESGMEKYLRVVERIDEISDIRFTSDDIVRSSFVKSWIKAVESTN